MKPFFMQIPFFTSTVKMSIVLSLFLIGSNVNAEDGAVEEAPPARLVITDENRADVVSVPMLGADAKEAVVYRGATGKSYYFQPALLPDWKVYTSDFESSCISGDVVNSSVNAKIGLPISVNSREYRKQIASLVVERGQVTNFSPNSLYFIPYDFMLVALNFNGIEKIIYSTDDEYLLTLQRTYRNPREASLEREITIPLDLPCTDHEQVVASVKAGDKNLLKASLFRTDLVYNRVNLHAFVSLELDKHIEASLFSDEATTARVKSEASGGGLSLNIPLVGNIGGGAGGAEVSSDSLRLVTRDVYEELLTEIDIEKNVACVGKSEQCVDLVKSVLPSLLNAKFDEAVLAQAENGFVIAGKQFDYVTMMDNSISGDLSNKIKTAGEAAQSGNVKLEAFDVGFKNQNKAAAEQAGAGKIVVDAPIATVADVIVISRNNFREEVELNVTLEIPEDSKQNPIAIDFLYPAEGYKNGDILSPEEVKNREVRKAQCLAGQRRERFVYKAKARSDRGTKPNAWSDWVAAAPEKGRYIESLNIYNTSSHNPKTEDRPLSYFHVGANEVRMTGMIHRKTARFHCYRGSSAPNRRTCTASGYIATLQQPLECAEFLVTGYNVAIGNN